LHASFEQCQSFWSFVRHVFHSRISKRALTKRSAFLANRRQKKAGILPPAQCLLVAS
jgi:hypothetical protein